MPLPSFIVVGAAKAGTTALHHYLNAHPAIFMPARKELHYFSHRWIGEGLEGPGDQRPWVNLIKTEEDYRRQFEDARTDQVVGEVSPSYLFFHQSIGLMKELLGPDVKVIIMLRDPVDRAVSNYLHLICAERETLSFGKALIVEEARKRAGYGDFWRYTEHSRYADQVAAYLDAFPREQVEVILFDDLKRRPEEVMRRVFAFVGVDPEYRPDNLGVVYNKSGRIRNRALHGAVLAPIFHERQWRSS
ncbi:MAG: hypothetical protein MAG453_01363 [Calditrichaeota bacterium]|nr:hypothetical protein [Calditrichota bacterium]